ncbi:hypothetical protein A2U01_0048472, partial [Trifolium medium]|nr:hypothetical protein [Trifolium medium]
ILKGQTLKFYKEELLRNSTFERHVRIRRLKEVTINFRVTFVTFSLLSSTSPPSITSLPPPSATSMRRPPPAQ